MTTRVTINAHVRPGLRVQVVAVDRHADPEMRSVLTTLADGEEYETHATDTRTIEVSEIAADDQ